MTPSNQHSGSSDSVHLSMNEQNAANFQRLTNRVLELEEQLEATQNALREFHEGMWTVQNGDGPEFVSSKGLEYMRGWFDRTSHLLPPESNPAISLPESESDGLRPGSSHLQAGIEGCTCLVWVDGLGNPDGRVTRDEKCPVHVPAISPADVPHKYVRVPGTGMNFCGVSGCKRTIAEHDGWLVSPRSDES